MLSVISPLDKVRFIAHSFGIGWFGLNKLEGGLTELVEDVGAHHVSGRVQHEMRIFFFG
jgi:hypothetical protein